MREFDTRLDDCRRLIELGAKVVTGSDSSWGDYELGNTAYETECLVMAGLSPMDGVLSVTSNAAAALDIDDRVGTLEPGKLADVIVVDGNPEDDIGDLWNVSEVFLGGRRIERGSSRSIAATRQWPPAGAGEEA
jgi:imidazolonepropionase-like amidohydrolase